MCLSLYCAVVSQRLPLHQRDPLGEYMRAQAGTAALRVTINELNVAARSTPQDFARMGIHTQFDARNPVHMRALSKAASSPTNNNVLASLGELRAVSTGAAAGTELLGRSAERALAPSTRK